MDISRINELNGFNVLTADNKKQFGEVLKSLNLCTGSADYTDVLAARLELRQPFLDTNMENTVAWAESSTTGSRLLKDEFDIIRSTSCTLLVSKNDICDHCSVFRRKLTVYRERLSHSSDRTSDSSHANFR